MSPSEASTMEWSSSATAQPSGPDQIVPDATLSIMIVDDDPFLRSIMTSVLAGKGFAIVEAVDGIEACNACEQHVPSLVIADALMPNMDGFELCRALRGQEKTRHIPILMATGLDDHTSIANAYDAGATDFIFKPLNFQVLHHRVRYMLRGASTLEALRQNQERLRISEELERKQSERLEAALANMSQGLCMFGADGHLIIANRRFRDIFQLPPSSIIPGRSMADILKDSPLLATRTIVTGETNLAQHLDLASRRDSAALTMELSDGRVVTINHEPMPDGGLVDTITDVTQQRLAEARIVHMALHDPLTDLPNRVLFRQRLDAALKRVTRGEHCAVFCLDLDQFKGVNDTLGHPVGDALLGAVSGRLSNLVRQADTVARLGGDEFAIVQTGLNRSEDAKPLARRILHELCKPYDLAGHQVIIGTSIGIAIAPVDGTDPDHLLKSADIALYQAKNNGRNCYCYFEPRMNAMLQVRRELELDLRRAAAAGEFELFFQPLVDMNANSVTAFEALLRWRHPRRGIILPTEFISLAEEIGLISQIGEWALCAACRQAQSWPGDFKVAVNVSALQFRNRQLVQTVMRALRESGLDPHRLELEITESTMIRDFDSVLSTLHGLKKLGVSISMDDFGTGYSSLSYLLGFPFDKVKIDQSFVRGLGSRSDCIAIIRAVTGMCDSLGITATAEGVETAEQLNLLRDEQCTEIQGFLVAEPCPADEVPALISDLSRRIADMFQIRRSPLDRQ